MSYKRNPLTTSTWWFIAIALAYLAYQVPWRFGNWPFLLPTFAWVLAFLLSILFSESSHGRKSLATYVWFSFAVLLIRLGFRLVFNTSDPFGAIALNLPTIRFSVGSLHIAILGPVSFSVLNAALLDGLRLAAVIMAFGMANVVASPQRLLRYAPAALHEVSLAFGIALNLAPQLVTHMAATRRALIIRGENRGPRSLGKTLAVVVDAALSSSVRVAASMETRGFGANPTAGRETKNLTHQMRRLATIGGLLCLLAASFQLVTSGLPLWLPLLEFALGLTLLWLGAFAGAQVARTRLRVERPGALDWAFRIFAISLLLATWPQLGW